MPLQAHYRLEDNAASTVVVDASGNGNHGTASRNTNLLTAVGKVGLGFNLVAASSDSVNCGDVNAMDLGPNQNVTYACWFSTATADTSWRVLIDKTQRIGVTNWFGFRAGREVTPNNRLFVQVFYGSAASSITLYSAGSVTDGAWHFMAATLQRDGNMTLYIDNLAPVTASISAYAATDLSNSASLMFGVKSDANSSNVPWNGLLDDVRCYNEALTAWQVADLFNFNRGTAKYDPWRKVFGGTNRGLRRAA